MIRTLALATLAASAFTLPAVAAENPSSNDSAASIHASELKGAYEAKQAHNILASRGYVNISTLNRDDDGRWVGTAVKDGKTIFVAVDLPKAHGATATN